MKADGDRDRYAERADDEKNQLLQQSMGEDSHYCVGDDEAIRVLRATAHGGCDADSLRWWRSNASRYRNIARLVRNLLALQTISVTSEVQPSLALVLISDCRGTSEDDTITACVCTRIWGKLTK